MTMIYVNVVRFQNLFELVYEGLASSLYTKDVVDLIDVIAIGSSIVDFMVAQASS